jgi:NTP pyrophosphatase (non-canonical NTP hydrolase)
VTAQLEHKLAESMWWVMTIADRLGIDIADAYATAMDHIADGLGGAVDSSAD